MLVYQRVITIVFMGVINQLITGGPHCIGLLDLNAEAIAVSTLHLAGFHSLYSVIFLRYSELLKVMVSQWYPNCLALFSHERFVVFFPTVVGGKDLPFMASLGKKTS